jgi:hypothetical protein
MNSRARALGSLAMWNPAPRDKNGRRLTYGDRVTYTTTGQRAIIIDFDYTWSCHLRLSDGTELTSISTANIELLPDDF